MGRMSYQDMQISKEGGVWVKSWSLMIICLKMHVKGLGNLYTRPVVHSNLLKEVIKSPFVFYVCCYSLMGTFVVVDCEIENR